MFTSCRVMRRLVKHALNTGGLVSEVLQQVVDVRGVLARFHIGRRMRTSEVTH